MNRFLILIAIFCSLNSYSQLSGTYTVGGISPTYSTIDSAVIALNAVGVSGPVIFKIRQGTYAKRISIGNITGASATNTILFKPDSNKTSGVVLSDSSTSSANNYVIRLAHSKYVTIRNLTINARGTSYSYGVLLVGKCNNIMVDSCSITCNSNPSLTSNDRRGVVELSGSANHSEYITISNCRIVGGVYGIWSTGIGSSDYQSSFKIVNNKIEDWIVMGIQLWHSFDTIQISHNQIIQKPNSSRIGSNGIYIDKVNVADVNSNQISMNSQASNGIRLVEVKGVTSKHAKLYNNMVSVISNNVSGTSRGLYLVKCSFINVDHNSVFLKTGLSNSIENAPLSGWRNIYIRNNIAVNESSNSSSYALYHSSSDSVANNVFWGPSLTKLKFPAGVTSKLVDPGYNTSVDLHTTNPELYQTGKSGTGVSLDVDGESRNTTKPCVGADEFTPLGRDASINFADPFVLCISNNGINVVVRNFGRDTIKSLTFNWSVKKDTAAFVNQTPSTISLNLATGEDTIIGVGNLVTNDTTFYQVKVWSTLPNGKVDSNLNNNSITSIQRFPSMSGGYTVGDTTSNYLTLDAALIDLNKRGLCGPVTFKLRPAIFNRSYVIKEYPGLDSNNTLTFTFDTATTGAVNWIGNFVLDNTHDINITGMVLKKSSYQSVMFKGTCSRINIKNNLFTSPLISHTSYTSVFIRRENTTNDSLTHLSIDSNRFVGGVGLAYLTTTKIGWDKHITISNNTYDSSGAYGIWCHGMDDVNILSNTISDRKAGNVGVGIALRYCKRFSIDKNKLLQINALSPVGITVVNCKGDSAAKSTVTNNYILQEKTYRGLIMSFSSNVSLYHNTYRGKGATVASKGLYVLNSIFDMENSILTIEPLGNLIEFNDNTSKMKSNYNGYFTTGSAVFFKPKTGPALDFTTWKSTYQLDSNSYFSNPFWRNTTDPYPNQILFDSSADYKASHQYDLQNIKRNGNADIGCVEFNPSMNDAGLVEVFGGSVCAGTSAVQIKVKNDGHNSITQIRIGWEISLNGGAFSPQSNYTWTGSLPVHADSLISVGNYTFSKGNSYSIRAYVLQVNNIIDTIRSNDTATVQKSDVAMSGSYTVGGTSPDFGKLDSALTKLNKLGVCGPVVLNVRGGNYNERIILNNVPYSDSVNTITIQTDTSSLVRARFYYHFSSVQIKDASNYILKNLNLETTGNHQTVFFGGTASNITFDNDSLFGSKTNSLSGYEAVIYDATTPISRTSDLTVNNCVIVNGSYSIFSSGSTWKSDTAYQDKIEFTNNICIGFYGTGCYIGFSKNSKVHNNHFVDRGGNSGSRGVLVHHGFHTSITKNDIRITGNQGIWVRYMKGDTSKLGAFIANNFVLLNNELNLTEKAGIRIASSKFISTIHNTTRIFGGSTNSTNFNLSVTDQILHYNNIHTNEGSGFAQIVDTNVTDFKSDFNNVTTKGINIGQFKKNFQNLSAWKLGTKLDSSSFNHNPLYYSNSDLHIRSVNLKGKGKNGLLLATDIDGEQRNLSQPDIGADEFKPDTSDVQLLGFENGSVCDGLNPVSLNLLNLGLDTLKQAKILWSVSENGGSFVPRPAYNFLGAIHPATDSILTIGTFNFKLGSTYSIKAVVDSVNNGLDQNSVNDSTQLDTVITRYGGWYSVGPDTTDNWKTIKSAVSALEKAGVCSAVTIYINGGTYDESVEIGKIEGSSSINSISFIGDSTSIISNWVSTSLSAPLIIKGSNNLNFEKLSFKALKPTNVVQFMGESSNIDFSNNEFVGYDTSSTNRAYANIYNHRIHLGKPNNQHYVSFINNEVRGGSFGIYWVGYNRGSAFEVGNKFISNHISNFNISGLELKYQAELEVIGNYIHTKRNTWYASGLDYIHGSGATIDRNEIVLSEYGTTAMILNGIEHRNNFENIVSNNFLVAGGQNISYGLQVSCDSMNIYNNSINLNSSSNSSVAVRFIGGYSNRFKNNVVSNSHGGKVMYITHPLVYIGDHNCLNTSGSILGQSPGNRNTLNDWVVATGSDSNSFSFNPRFIDSLNLHTVNSLLENKGDSLGITEDIDGEPRTVFPDLGADEINVIKTDIAFKYGVTRAIDTFCLNSGGITWEAINLGRDTIKSIDYTLEIWQGAVKIFTSRDTINDTLAYRQRINIEDSLKAIQTNGQYRIKIYSTLVNGSKDSNASNDSLEYVFFYNPLPSVTFSSIPSYCQSQDSVMLNFASSPNSIIYSGTNVHGSWFFPSKGGAGIHKIEIKATASNGCSSSVDTVLNVYAAMPASIDTILPKCNNAPNFTVSQGKPKGGNYFGPYMNDSTFAVGLAGTGFHPINYFTIDSNGCSDTASRIVQVLSPMVLKLDTASPVCENSDSVALPKATPTGGQFFGDFVKSSTQFFFPPKDSSGSFQYSYTYTDTLGCIDTIAGAIKINPNPKVDIGKDTNFCKTEIFFLKSNISGASNKWNIGSTLDSILVLEAGTYSLIVTDSNGCVGNDTILVSYKKGCTGINSLQLSTNLNLYPNPFTDVITVDILAKVKGDIKVKIRSVDGKLIEERKWMLNGQESTQHFDLRHMSNGVYYFEIISNNESIIRQVILNK